MSFSKLVLLSRSISLPTCNIPAKWIRLVCPVIFFAVVFSSLPVHLKRDGASAKSHPPRRTQGPPSQSLPNLEETYANAASGGKLKEFGLTEPSSPAATQSVTVVTVYPTAYQTPNGSGTPIDSVSNTGGSAYLSVSNGSPTITETCRWYGFPNVPGQIISVRLRMDWSASGSTMGPTGGGGGFSLAYTGGSGAGIGGSNFSQTSSVDVALPTGQDLTQVQVSMSFSGGAGPNTTFSGNASVSNIRIEVEIECIASVPAGRWRGEYFNNQTLSGNPSMVRDDGDGFLNQNFGSGSPNSICAPAVDNFSARWTRTVNFAEGIYRFTASVDNGVRLYVDGHLRIDRWGDLPPSTYRADVFLSAGNHEIKLEYIEYTDGASVSLSWTAVAAASGNMAFGKPASQSSTYSNATADRAIDGNTNGNYFDNSVTHTNLEHQPWWQVDLGSVQQIGEIILRNRTDCCGERLSNFYVLISDNPFSSTDLTATINQAGVSSYYTADPVGIAKEIGVYRSGKYVRVQLAGDNYLQLAEVEVRGMASRSLAFGKPVSQSSTNYGADAFRAVDSNTSGNWADNSVTHTTNEHQPWWQVDLGSVQQIGAVILWNRTDCCSERLSNFYVLISDNPFSSTDLTATINQAGVSSYYTADPVGIAKEIGVYRSGRYVRVQLAGDNSLHLAEVEVRSGASLSGCVANVPVDRWKGEYFNNTTLMGSPAMVRDDGSSFLNFDFGAGGPGAACGLSAEYFSARWMRTVNFPAGTYRFIATVDNGVKLYVDGQVKIDQLGNQPPNTYTADVALSGGAHEIKLEFVEYTGDARVSLFWTDVNCLANVPAGRWRGEYFNNITLSGHPLSGLPWMIRDDGVGFLNFNFGDGGPGGNCGLGVDNFSARWTRTANFGSGVYRFSVTGDDGVKLYVDGQIKIDKWFAQGATTYTADVQLSAGNHEVKLEYFESGGPGVALLSWTLVTSLSCLPDVPLIGAAPQTGGVERIATTPVSEAPKRCGQKSSE
jgi:hypothetical protein